MLLEVWVTAVTVSAEVICRFGRRQWVRLTPLCPAGHLPHKEGDRLGALTPLHSRHERWPRGLHESISPPVGEMAGRPEGGEPHPLPSANLRALLRIPALKLANAQPVTPFTTTGRFPRRHNTKSANANASTLSHCIQISAKNQLTASPPSVHGPARPAAAPHCPGSDQPYTGPRAASSRCGLRIGRRPVCRAWLPHVSCRLAGL